MTAVTHWPTDATLGCLCLCLREEQDGEAVEEDFHPIEALQTLGIPAGTHVRGQGGQARVQAGACRLLRWRLVGQKPIHITDRRGLGCIVVQLFFL